MIYQTFLSTIDLDENGMIRMAIKLVTFLLEKFQGRRSYSRERNCFVQSSDKAGDAKMLQSYSWCSFGNCSAKRKKRNARRQGCFKLI
jgi:hypothetical protein